MKPSESLSKNEQSRAKPRRATALLGGLLVFSVVFLFLGFIVAQMTEGSAPLARLAGQAICVVIALAFARSSYRRTLADPAPRSWRLQR